MRPSPPPTKRHMHSSDRPSKLVLPVDINWCCFAGSKPDGYANARAWIAPKSMRGAA